MTTKFSQKLLVQNRPSCGAGLCRLCLLGIAYVTCQIIIVPSLSAHAHKATYKKKLKKQKPTPILHTPDIHTGPPSKRRRVCLGAPSLAERSGNVLINRHLVDRNYNLAAWGLDWPGRPCSRDICESLGSPSGTRYRARPGDRARPGSSYRTCRAFGTSLGAIKYAVDVRGPALWVGRFPIFSGRALPFGSLVPEPGAGLYPGLWMSTPPAPCPTQDV